MGIRITNSCEVPQYSAVKLQLNPKYNVVLQTSRKHRLLFFSCSATSQMLNDSLEMLISCIKLSPAKNMPLLVNTIEST